MLPIKWPRFFNYELHLPRNIQSKLNYRVETQILLYPKLDFPASRVLEEVLEVPLDDQDDVLEGEQPPLLEDVLEEVPEVVRPGKTVRKLLRLPAVLLPAQEGQLVEAAAHRLAQVEAQHPEKYMMNFDLKLHLAEIC